MLTLRLKSWKAVTPELGSNRAWQCSADHPSVIDINDASAAIKQIPPMLRRRFNLAGRCVIGAAIPLLEIDQQIPSVFVSKHADAQLSLSLQKDLGQDLPVSPTDFSLAVHNAISGLLSIARKDTSAVTSIAPEQGMVVNGLVEALGLLQEHDEVLCVFFDAPLPELIDDGSTALSFPFAIAMLLSNNEGQCLSLEQLDLDEPVECPASSADQTTAIETCETEQEDINALLSVLVGSRKAMSLTMNNCRWSLKVADA